jgi:hypothetical protein
MNRDEAVACLKEIDASYKGIFANAISLVKSKPDNPISTGYELHIKTALDAETKIQLKGVAQKKGLELIEEKDEVIIYKPKVVANALP